MDDLLKEMRGSSNRASFELCECDVSLKIMKLEKSLGEVADRKERELQQKPTGASSAEKAAMPRAKSCEQKMYEPDEEQLKLRSQSVQPGECRIYQMAITVDGTASYNTIQKIIEGVLPGCDFQIKGPQITRTPQGVDLLQYTIYATLDIGRIGDEAQRNIQNVVVKHMLDNGVKVTGKLRKDFEEAELRSKDT